MTKTYAQLQAEIAELEKLASDAKREETKHAVEKIHAIMAEYNLTLADIAKPKKPAAARKPVEVKYRDTATGETWTGRGRAPRWLEGKNKDDYKVTQAP